MRIPKAAAAILAAWLQATTGLAQNSAQAGPLLGPAPEAPRDAWNLPGGGPRKLDGMEEAGFSVNAGSREQVRQFYNAVYRASEGVPINSTAEIGDCIAGTNSADFENAVLWRINWFRAMSGVPAAVTFSASESAGDQSAALMISANNSLQHTGIPAGWSCFDTNGTNAAAHSNLALGLNGPDAITSYICDFGSPNAQVGHRRLLLYPQTQVMASGDMPAQGEHSAANATWVVDANYGGPRPPTAAPYVAWPPPGYVPCPVVFPQWSFALSNATFSSASVTMQSNGVPLSVVIQPYELGYGENTLVWHPAALDPAGYGAVFPFNGADTVYAVTISNVLTIAGFQSFSYNVTVFDPASPGTDSVPTAISGSNRPFVNESNPYSCTPSANPNATGYQWVAWQATNGNLADHALNGLTNFTFSPPPIYSVITNPPAGPGKCFHLTHTNAAPQLLEFREVLFPATNTALRFQSLLGWAATNQVARVQISTNDGVWVDIYSQAGTGGSGQASFVAHTLSLSNCAGRITRLRFNYDYIASTNAYYNESFANVGWCLENIVITYAGKLVNSGTNATLSTNFNFVPGQTGNWVLEARGVLFGQFGLGWSPASLVAAGMRTCPLAVQANGGGTISPNYKNQSLVITSNYSIKATAASGFRFTNWTGGTNQPFNVLADSRKLTFRMESNLTLIANFVDDTPPGITITSPAANHRWSNSTFTAMGTAKDNVQISNVLCQLNGSGWIPATASNNTWSNWTATLANLESTNLFEAYAVDIAGNSSPTNQVHFLYIPSAMLAVGTNGNGKITPVDNGKLLAIGTNYTLTAAAGKNWLFSNWVGGTNLTLPMLSTASTLSASPSYKFPMQSNLVLQANFVTNPFLAVAGVYDGLFYPTNGVTEAGSGFISVTIAGNSAGAYSAKLLLDGETNSFSGSFDLTGTAHQTNLARKGKTPVSVTLNLDFAPDDALISGSVSNAAAEWNSVIQANRAVFSASANPATNYAGHFTLLFPPDTNAPVGSPDGYGYAAVTNTLTGISTLGGALADGTRLLWSAPISRNGAIPLYQSLYSGKGSLLGWIYLANEPPQNVSTNSWVSWIKPAVPKTLYPSGFTNLTGVLGSPYTNTAKSGLPLLNLTNATLLLTNGNLTNGDLIYTNIGATPASHNTLTNLDAGNTNLSPTNRLLIAINTNNGLVTVTFRETGSKMNTVAHGAVLQNQTNAAGYFLGTNQTGAFRLSASDL